MSNLKLPTLTYDALREGKRIRDIAYATSVHTDDTFVALFHHKSPIAILHENGLISLNNHGHHTRTTADRLNRVCRDNGLAYRVRIQKGQMVLQHDETGKQIPMYGAFGLAADTGELLYAGG